MVRLASELDLSDLAFAFLDRMVDPSRANGFCFAPQIQASSDEAVEWNLDKSDPVRSVAGVQRLMTTVMASVPTPGVAPSFCDHLEVETTA